MNDNCPKHNIPRSVPTYKGLRECPICLDEVQERLIKYMEKKK